MNEVEKLRKKLHEAIDKYGINSKEIYKLSTEMDKLLNKRGYDDKNVMYNKYLDSMYELRKISKEFGEFPTVEEWNQYAKTNNLLNSESLKYISGMNWHKLKNKIKQEMKLKK